VVVFKQYNRSETTIGNIITAPVDANPGDILSKLTFAGILSPEAHNNKWAFTSEILYMNLNQEI
jgi:hypothetical protein